MIRASTKILVAGVMAVAFSSSAFAVHTLRHQQETDPFGTPAPEAAASRVIKLDSNTKAIRVTRRETATITKDGKSFTWNFYTFNAASFNLGEIAPKDFGANQVRVYVDLPPEDSSN